MKKQKGIGKIILFLLLVPIVMSLVSGAVNVSYDQPLPRVIINPPSSSLTCEGCNSTTYINQTIINLNDTIWTNDSTYVYLRTGYDQSILLANASIYLSGTDESDQKIIRIIAEEEGEYGVHCEGLAADCFVAAGIFPAINVFSGYGYNAKTIFFPQGGADRDWFGFLGSSPIIGSNNASQFYGAYLTTIANAGAFPFVPFTGYLEDGSPLATQIFWDSGTTGNLSNIHILEPQISGGNLQGLGQGGILIENQINYSIQTKNGKVIFGDNVTAPNLCYSNGSNCQASSGNPFNQSLNTSDGVRFKNISIVSSGLTEVPLTLRSNFNASLTSTSFLKIIDNQSITIFDFAGGGGLTLFAPGNGRTMTFSPANGALDMAGSSFNLNRFSTSSNVVIGGTGGSGVSSSLLIGNGVGNTNFGSELGKLFVGVVGNNSRLIVAKGGLGQTKSAISVLNFTGYEVFNVSTRGEVMATNITAQRLDLTPVALPTCNANSRGFWVNSSDTKPYYCNTTAWSALY